MTKPHDKDLAISTVGLLCSVGPDRGQTVAEARLVAITAEPEIVARFIRELAGEAEGAEEQREPLRLVERDGE